jgi:aspartyl-tRNA(Asn)/glutamyl-tRNA(Gln) amidotransferase subunit C
MATVEDVKKLAALARITVTDEEAGRFAKEFDSILAYVGQIESLSIPEGVKSARPVLRNVLREDGEPHESGLYTDKLAAQFPDREGDALKVKQIIAQD